MYIQLTDIALEIFNIINKISLVFYNHWILIHLLAEEYMQDSKYKSAIIV